MPLDQLSENPEPRWPVTLALLAIGGLHATLPPALLVFGSRWLLLVSLSVLLVPTLLAHRRGRHSLNQGLGYILNGVITLAMTWSVAMLIDALLAHAEAPKDLLVAAAALWVSNILVFASWYWRLDAGGPHHRARTRNHTDGAFLFPQMTMPPEVKLAANEEEWVPHFVDYLFLAFNTSTAFSPTDSPVLSRWAKILMMLQSVISLLVVALLAARAVNIL
jgi:hypothetical protein